MLPACGRAVSDVSWTRPGRGMSRPRAGRPRAAAAASLQSARASPASCRCLERGQPRGGSQDHSLAEACAVGATLSSVHAQDAAVDRRRHRQPLEEQVEAAPDSDAWLLAAEPQGALVQEAVARIHLAEGRGAGGRGARGGRCVCVWSAVPVPYSSVTWLGVREGVRGGVRGGGARGSLAASLRLGRLAIAEISPRSRRALAEISPRETRGCRAQGRQRVGGPPRHGGAMRDGDGTRDGGRAARGRALRASSRTTVSRECLPGSGGEGEEVASDRESERQTERQRDTREEREAAASSETVRCSPRSTKSPRKR